MASVLWHRPDIAYSILSTLEHGLENVSKTYDYCGDQQRVYIVVLCLAFVQPYEDINRKGLQSSK